jgi:hypothetical protein
MELPVRPLRDGAVLPARAHQRRRQSGYAHDRSLSSSNQRIADNAVNHIFVGHSSYPPQHMGDDIDWSKSPTADREWLWQLHRLRWWTTLGQAHWRTGDEKYARAWAHQLLDWVAKNPRHPASAYAWRSIETGHRATSWTSVFQYFIDTPVMTPQHLVVFLGSMHEHATLLIGEYSAGSNWSVIEAQGLLHAAVCFPEFRDAERWQREAVRRLNAEITNQVHPDGHQRELSIIYHGNALQNFRGSYELARMNRLDHLFPSAFHERLERMAEVFMKLAMPDGTLPMFGSAWMRSEGHAWSTLREWADVFNRADFRYLATRGREGRPPRQTAFALRDSGLYSMRSGWDENATCLILKCGPDGGVHSHPDNGTFELYAGGRRLMPDSGVYIYSGDDEARNWFRQSRVHQTLTLDGRNIAYAPRRLLWETSGDHDILVVENRSYPDLTHRRAVIFVNRTYFLIIDEALGEAEGELRLHYQLAPGRHRLNASDLQFRTDSRDETNLLVQGFADDRTALVEEEGWVSFEYGKRERRPAAAFVRQKSRRSAGERFITVLMPHEGRQPPTVQVRVLDGTTPGSSPMRVRVTVDGRRTEISYTLPR